jgi:DNA recombination protein RmuC
VEVLNPFFVIVLFFLGLILIGWIFLSRFQAILQRKHIDAIAGKYIVPEEGTYDFALMYVPAENVYYETIIKDELSGEKDLGQYALSKRVIPVSPNCFYAYLQAIVLGLKGMKIEERAKEIIQYLNQLQGDFSKFREDFGLVGKHLGHAQSTYQNAEKRLDQFTQRLVAADAEPRETLKARSDGRNME